MFNALHCQSSPLLLANVWDASSALAAEQAGFHALGTSSAAISHILGYQDGEGMGFDELFYMVSRIRSVTSLPLSVDIEAGYSVEDEEIISNIRRLAAAGVVGINIEDSHCHQGVRYLDDPIIFADKLQKIALACPEIFLNVRSDSFLLGVENALEETLRRGQLYAAQGADGLFVPCITEPADIQVIIQQIALPLNVMYMPNLPNIATLAALGVKRISMGNALHAAAQKQLSLMLSHIQSTQAFHGI